VGAVKLYCDCCGRPYSHSRAREIAADVLGQVAAVRLDDMDLVFNHAILGSDRITILERAGYVTLGDAIRAGSQLLDLRGIGPSTVATLKAFHGQALVRTLWERHGAVLRQPEDDPRGRS
jgi:hypothetical protein